MMPLLDAPSSVALMAAFALARAATVKSQSTTVYLQKSESEGRRVRGRLVGKWRGGVETNHILRLLVRHDVGDDELQSGKRSKL